MTNSENPGIEQLRDQLTKLGSRVDALSAILHVSMVTVDGGRGDHLGAVRHLLTELAASGEIDGPAVLDEFRKIIGHS